MSANLNPVIASLAAAVPVLDGWPVPESLPDTLPRVASFDPELLPDALRPWISDIANRMQVPIDFPAVSAIVALSSLIGARVVIKPKERDDWAVVPNLWGGIVARAGGLKSPTFSETLRPLNKIEAKAREAFELKKEDFDLEVKVAEMATEMNGKEAKGLAVKNPAKARELLRPVALPPSPIEPRYIVNDATVEKLGECLRDNPWGFLAYRDELFGLLKSMDKEGQEGARAFYLQAYDGNQSYTFDRIARGTVRIPRVCLSLLGGIQPSRLQGYVREAVSGGAGDDGLLQRFGLLVWPDSSPSFINVDQWPDSEARQRAYDVFDRLAAITPEGEEAAVWKFTPAAQSLFNEWRESFEYEIRSDQLHPALISHLSKYRKLIPALSLIFALIDTPTAGVVGEAQIIRALAWCEYLRTHAERVYSAAVMPETGAAKALLSKITAGQLGEVFTARLVVQKSWTGLGSTEAVRKAADLLVDYDYLRGETIHTGGRPSDQYLVNPRVWRPA